MRRLLSILLITCSLFLASTFAGMAFFGMGTMVNMDHGACADASCDSMPHDASGAQCVEHCLSIMPSSSPVAPMLLVFVAVMTIFLIGWTLNISRFFLSIRRWHADIGKFLLHQNLSTIVLRN